MSIPHESPAKDIVLYSIGTPNGYSVSILFEELKVAYGGPDYQCINMMAQDEETGEIRFQGKQSWYLQINPNGRIPAITDKGFNVIETSAILLYLTAEYDKDHLFGADPSEDRKQYSEELQWLFFVHGGLGPTQGQAAHFLYSAPDQIPYSITRFVGETMRVYSVLETRLIGRDYLTGPGRGKYGVADIKTYPWIKDAGAVAVDISRYPNLKAWCERLSERPGVKAGMNVPWGRYGGS